ncbi:MAG: hypothetical protein HYU66_03930 [Armatimonadetes bacterium]|nr:hypothetical protein [Armatimonadota bacterium]
MLLVALLAAAALAAAGKVRVLVGGERVAGEFRLQGGAVIGPVAPVAEKLGATAEWQADERALAIEPPPLFRQEEMESLSGHLVSPFSTLALGPAITVRQELARRQAEQLAKRDPAAPLLARYDVVSAVNWYSGPLSSDPDVAGYSVTARLYLLVPDPQDPCPLDGRYVTGDPTGGGIEWRGPRPEKMLVEEREFHLTPTVSTKAEPAEGPGKWTAAGWKIDEEKLVNSGPVKLKDGDLPVPVLDPVAENLRR